MPIRRECEGWYQNKDEKTRMQNNNNNTLLTYLENLAKSKFLERLKENTITCAIAL